MNIAAFRLFSITVFILASAAVGNLAKAQIYVADSYYGSIGDYTLSGQPVFDDQLANSGSGSGVAISGNDLFVSDSYNNVVAEYNATTGAPINTHLITGLGGENPYSLATSGNVLYVSKGNGVAEYTTSGALINGSFITGLAGTGDITLAGNDLFVVNNAGYSYSIIEEFDATTGAVINPSLISGSVLADTFGLTASGGYLYTTSYAGGYVAKFTLSGQLVNSALVSGLGDAGAVDVAVSGNDLYVTDASADSVREYDATTGAPINTDLINVQYFPHGIVVTPEPRSWNLFACGAFFLIVVSRWRHKIAS